MDSYEEMIVPEAPKALPNEQLFIYVPIASDDTPGVAKFDSEYFSVDTDGMVSLRSIGRCGRISIPRDQWTDGSPTKALIEVPGVDDGSVIIMLPADDDTRLIANRARLSAYPVAFTPLDGVSSVTILRSDAEMAPDGDMTFVYLVLKTSLGSNPIAAIIGVDAYGEGGGTASGVDEDAVKKIINSLLGNVENVKQYSADNPPPYPVTAVNGKTGAVMLTIPSEASDINAEEAGAVSAHNADQAAHPYLSGRVANALDRIGGHDTDIEEINTSMAERLKIADLAAKLDAYKTAQGLVGKTTTDLTNYYLKGEVYTKDEVAALISAIPKFEIKVVSSLPTANISLTTVYLVKDTTEGGGLYTEYIYVNGAWEELGNQSLDLSGYVTDEELGGLLKSYATLTKVSELIADALKPYATDEELAEAIRVATVNLVTGAQVTTAITNALNSYYTSAQVDAQIAARISSALTPYITASKAAELYQPKGNYLTQHQSLAHLLPRFQGIENAGKYMIVGADGYITLVDAPETGDVTGVLGEDLHISLSGDIPKGTYTMLWTDDKGNTYDAGSLTVGEMYTVTANLTNCTISNTGRVLEGRPYTATVTPDSGHELTSITVTMGSDDITGDAVNGEEISIASVTGDVTITAVAAEKAETYTILSYAEVGAEPGEVDTGYVATAKTGFAISFAATITGTASGARYNNGFCGNKAFSVGMVTDNARAFKGSVKSFELFKDSDTADHDVKLNYNGDGACEIDGKTKGWNQGGSAPTDFTETLRIFTAGTHSTLSKGARYLRVYEYVITENGSVVRTLKPCRRGKDGNIGFYDTISGVFYHSTGSVTGGAVVEEISL